MPFISLFHRQISVKATIPFAISGHFHIWPLVIFVSFKWDYLILCNKNIKQDTMRHEAAQHLADTESRLAFHLDPLGCIVICPRSHRAEPSQSSFFQTDMLRLTESLSRNPGRTGVTFKPHSSRVFFFFFSSCLWRHKGNDCGAT